MIGMSWRRDPEVHQMTVDSLGLVVQSEKILARLEEHLQTLREFVDEKNDMKGEPEGGNGHH